MMRILKNVSFLVVVSSLAACAAAPQKPMTITNVKTVVVQTPAPLLRDCPVSAPPDQKTYMALDMSGRENSLTNYILDLLKDLKNCNTQIDQIRTFQDQQVQIYNKPTQP
jgi:hypothetical protein